MPVGSEENEIKNTWQSSLRLLERDEVLGKFLKKEEKPDAAWLELNYFASLGEISMAKASFSPVFFTLNTEFL